MIYSRYDKEASASWLNSRGLIPTRIESHYQFHGNELVVYYSQPEKNGRIAALSKFLGALFDDESELFILVNEWGVFPTFESPVLVDRVLQGYGDGTPLIKKRGFQFKPVEREETADFLRLIMMCCWDAIIVGKGTGVALEFSHDEWGSFIFEDIFQKEEFLKRKFIEDLELEIYEHE